MTARPLVDFALSDSVATIAMDDGKANVMSEAMQRELTAALDRAENAGAVVLLTGRDGIFSGGYDRAMFARSRDEIVRTLRTGGGLVERILGFPRPVVVACNGHAVAQGAFLLLAADVRAGAAGDFRIGLNEVAIGLTIPHYGVELARLRLTPPWFNRATVTGALFGPEDACAAGFLDRLASPAELLEVARAEARLLVGIDPTAHAFTKQRVRRHALAAIREGIESEFAA